MMQKLSALKHLISLFLHIAYTSLLRSPSCCSKYETFRRFFSLKILTLYYKEKIFIIATEVLRKGQIA